jgi:hypothetical protein
MEKLLQLCRVAINAVSAVVEEENEEENQFGYTLHLEQTAFAGLIFISKEDGYCLFRSYAPLRGRHQALVEAAVAANADLVSGSFARECAFDPDEQTIAFETYIHHPEELNPTAFIARLRRNRDLFAFCLPLLEAVAVGELEPHDFNRQLREATRRRPLEESRAPERQEGFSDAQFDTHVSFSRGRAAHCEIVSPLDGLAIPYARVTSIAGFCLDAQRLGHFGSFAWPELGEGDEPLQFQTICWGPANTQRERVSIFAARHREALAACLPLLEALASETLEQAEAEAALLALARARHWV